MHIGAMRIPIILDDWRKRAFEMDGMNCANIGLRLIDMGRQSVKDANQIVLSAQHARLAISVRSVELSEILFSRYKVELEYWFHVKHNGIQP